eukprot:4012995-Pleurochrysis_carterae.AAC.1
MPRASSCVRLTRYLACTYAVGQFTRKLIRELGRAWRAASVRSLAFSRARLTGGGRKAGSF